MVLPSHGRIRVAGGSGVPQGGDHDGRGESEDYSMCAGLATLHVRRAMNGSRCRGQFPVLEAELDLRSGMFSALLGPALVSSQRGGAVAASGMLQQRLEPFWLNRNPGSG